ncbi:DUF6797 domain-containing protein [Verrucomicrobium spinosum]|uniref:DUF6797 domain-containing protein n=2 Tax=Verrucomicrobium spinosum TaxID=2736 RepID=UPI0001746979|nr:DUF6797 domain-containing protein [Verrucomicrobium spinosum]
MRWFVLPALLCLAASPVYAAPPAAPASTVKPARDRNAVFASSNLAAWCIVPFDAKKRGPEERAAMLEKLGITRLVYDYRAEHVPTFEAEIEALARHHVRLTGWWFPTSLTPEAKHILDLIKRHGLKECDLWITGGGPAPATPAEEETRLTQEVERIKPLAAAAADAGVKVGLYNHGGWFGEPETQLKIIEKLQQQSVSNVGMVYNLHHGHSQVDRLAQVLRRMIPHLLCLNLNGMVPDGEAKGQKIVPIAQGELDLQLLRVIRDSGYQGPIGILNHTNEDAEARLQDNLDGLRWLVKQLDGGEAGPRPVPRSWKAPAPAGGKGDAPSAAVQSQGPQLVPSRSEVLGKALKGGLVLAGKDDFHELPITVECLARLDSARGFNILVACEPKTSPLHWELYSYAGSGVFSLYMPGRGGEYKSQTNICDGQWHRLSAVIESDRVRLKVDNKQVLDVPVTPTAPKSHPTQGIAFGRLVERGLSCDGIIDEVRIARGNSNPVGRGEPLLPTDATIGLWNFDNIEVLKKEASSSSLEPEPFSYVRDPLNPGQWPNRQEPVNRDRIYDYYPKQAVAFKGRQAEGLLLPPYPGLDGGTQGHWGNQSDDTWRDGRWRGSDMGNLFSGVLKGDGLVVPKGVSVRLGGEGELAACFDPVTVSFPLVWKGGFIKLSEVRHGFMEAAKPGGATLQKSALPPLPASLKYHGFYRHGNRVLFAYQLDGVEMLDAMGIDNGTPVRLRARAEAHPWKDLRNGGPARWTQVLETKGTLGEGRPYALDTLTLPYDNPYGALFFVSDHDFLSDDTLALCTMTGEVWLVRGVNASLARLTWKRFATGLHQPQGLVVADGKICVLGRDQITRLHDVNGDDEADFYECVTNAMITSPSGHDYLCGLQWDGEGRFYFSSGNQGVCRVKPGGEVEVLATGFRNPNGLGLSAEGRTTTSCQEGDWTPASMVCEVKEGGFYGLGGPRPGKTVEPPLLYLPRGVDNSSGGQCYVESDAWGVPRGTLLTFSCGACTGLVVLRDVASGQAQGAAWELPADFLSGAQRGRFHGQDGQLYVSGMYGWGCYGPKDGCLQRVRFTGGTQPLPVGWEVRRNGVMITFNHPVDAAVTRDARQHFVQVWNYLTSSAYGSQEWSVKHPKTAGHDALEVTSVQVLEGGRRLFLEVPELMPASQIHLHVMTGPDKFADLYGTVHQLGQPFTDFPGAKPLVAKALSVPAGNLAVTTEPTRVNPWAKGEGGRSVKLEAALGLQFAQKQLVAKSGERLSLEFSNPDAVPHNVLFIKPGALQRVGDLANKMITDPAGLARHYVPESPEVLVYTDMVQPSHKFTIHFNAPQEKGEYPYLCTFPGHWLVMNGVLKVE